MMEKQDESVKKVRPNLRNALKTANCHLQKSNTKSVQLHWE